MAAKKSKSDVDQIRGELRTLAEAVWALRQQVAFEAAAAAANGHDASVSGARVAEDLSESDGRGMVVSRGVVRSSDGEREWRWESEVSAEALLSVETEHAAKILAAIGHPQRLAIAQLLLNGPTTAALIVSSLELGTTGAAYHHLNVLQGAGLVSQTTRGVFELTGERAGSVAGVLAAIGSTSVATVADASADEDRPESKKRRGKSS